MISSFQRRDVLRLAAASAAVFVGGAHAQAAWPNRIVTMVVPFPAGGGTDIIARLVGKNVGDILGQPFVVENRAGGGGAIGISRVVRATPDGYTLLLGVSGPNAVLPATKKLPYDPVNDLIPIAVVAQSSMFLVVQNNLPVKTLQELIALAKASPGKLNFGNTGVGGYAHLATTNFARRLGIQVAHIPYPGNAPAAIAFKRGDIDAMFVVADLAKSMFEAGSVRYLAVAGDKRLPSAPDLPALTESLPGFVAETWWGVLAPRGTPPEIVAQLEKAISTAMALPELQAQLRKQDLEPRFVGKDQFGKALRDEISMWTKLVEDTGMKVE